MYRFFKLFTLAIFVFVFSSCLSHKMQSPLKLENASYQTWDAGAKHRGTKVEAVLIGETEQVKITGLIFRSKCTIPIIKNREGKLFIIADFDSGMENKTEGLIVGSKIDMITYTYKGKIYELPLKDIQRKPMKYYPK